MPSTDTTPIPSFRSYGNYASSNYGAHTLAFDVNGVTYFFSYKTLVAFQAGFRPPVVRKNEWGPTTGKHLNWIDGGDKRSRVDETTLLRLLAEATK